jgi:hypothetical protein
LLVYVSYWVRMYIATVPNRGSPPAILIRESYRDGGKVKSRTIANITSWPAEKIAALREVLAGRRGPTGPAFRLEDAFDIVRTQPHGHVAAVLGTLRRLELHELIDRRRSSERDLVEAMIVSRIVEPQSKLATARGFSPETLDSSLGRVLDLEHADEDDLYAAMDWLAERQARIEDRLAQRHLAEGALVLYDVSSTYFEGRHCPLAKLGHSRDGKRDKLQIVFGLLANAAGCPVAVEVFEGNVGDPKTLAVQVRKLRERFGIQRLVLVGDRGMITEARIREDLATVEGLDWITALRAPAIRKLVEDGSLQLSLFDHKDMAEISDPQYPGERLVVCKNPLLAEERRRKRGELLDATEAALAKVAARTRQAKRPLQGLERIALAVGRVLGRFKMAKHFRIECRDDGLIYSRNEQSIAEEAKLDGFYVVRTSVDAKRMSAADTVRNYKGLSRIERAFRCIKTMDLKVRPIHHRKEERVRAHVFLCMLAYYVEWHMREALAPILFEDDEPEKGEALRTSVVAPAQRSPAAQDKAREKRTKDDLPVHGFQTLLDDLATIAINRVRPKAAAIAEFDKLTDPTALQARAFKLLGVSHRYGAA